MGLFNTMRFEAGLPGFGLSPETEYQTKSLFCTMTRLTVSREGLLIEHRVRYDIADLPDGLQRLTPVPAGIRDLDYHGDIELWPLGTGPAAAPLVARFTHGQLEWVKPHAELSDVHRAVIAGHTG